MMFFSKKISGMFLKKIYIYNLDSGHYEQQKNTCAASSGAGIMIAQGAEP